MKRWTPTGTYGCNSKEKHHKWAPCVCIKNARPNAQARVSAPLNAQAREDSSRCLRAPLTRGVAVLSDHCVTDFRLSAVKNLHLSNVWAGAGCALECGVFSGWTRERRCEGGGAGDRDAYRDTRNDFPLQYAGNWERSLIKKTCTAILTFTPLACRSEEEFSERGLRLPTCRPLNRSAFHQIARFRWTFLRHGKSTAPLPAVCQGRCACVRELARGVTGCIASSPCHVVTLVTPCMTQSLSWNFVWRNPSLYNVQFPQNIVSTL